MKMHAIGLPALFSIALIAGACLPEPLPIEDIPALETKIVVSSQMLPRQGVVIALTKSLGALDAGSGSDLDAVLEQILLDDAVMTLHYDDRVDSLINLGNGMYADPSVTLRKGVRYKLIVNSASMGEVWAETSLASPVALDSAGVQLVSSSLDPLLQVNYSLTDPPGKNYYVVSVQRVPDLQDASSLLNPAIFNHLFDDTDFEAQEIRGQFSVFYPRFSPGDSVAVFLSTVSREYYDFLQLRNDDRFNLAAFASEPLRYPSNVVGGYGFFNLHIPDVRLFRLP
jgi:hypothetical protein